MASIKTKFKIEGLKELEDVLKELPKSTQRNVLKRALMKSGAPMAQMASALAPRRKGKLQQSIIVSSRVKNNTGKAEYASAMAAGLGKDAARDALIAARRSAKGSGSHAEVYVGPTADAFYGMFQEFGTSRHAAKPFMRPAFDAQAPAALDSIRDDLKSEIDKTVARIARKAAREAAKMKSGG